MFYFLIDRILIVCQMIQIIASNIETHLTICFRKQSTIVCIIHTGYLIYSSKKFCTTYNTFFVFTTVGCTASYIHHSFCPNYMIFLWFCTPPLSFETVYCFICDRRRVAVARYRMSCLVLKTLRVCIFAKCEEKCKKQYINHVWVSGNKYTHF